jgi:hypothetical protein
MRRTLAPVHADGPHRRSHTRRRSGDVCRVVRVVGLDTLIGVADRGRVAK